MCRTCASGKKKNNDCRRNHKGSLKSMEPDVAVDLFQRPVKNGVKYNIFSNSPRAALMWKDLTGRKPKRFSESCWWSRWEVFKQCMEQCGDVQRLLEDAVRENVVPQISRQLVDIWKIQARFSVSSLS